MALHIKLEFAPWFWRVGCWHGGSLIAAIATNNAFRKLKSQLAKYTSPSSQAPHVSKYPRKSPRKDSVQDRIPKKKKIQKEQKEGKQNG